MRSALTVILVLASLAPIATSAASAGIAPRHAHRAPARKLWICPERPDGTNVWSRALCVLEVDP